VTCSGVTLPFRALLTSVIPSLSLSFSCTVWDSDKRTADDIVGRVQRKLSDLVKGSNVNKFIDLEDGLMGFEDADTMQGKLHWRVGFFEKAKLNRDLIKTAEQKEGDTALQKEATDRQATSVDSNEEADALKCPPDTKWPSGILSMQVDSIIGLERRDVEKGVKGKEREGTQGQDVTASGETPDHLPNGYCELILNDDIVYKTRWVFTCLDSTSVLC
jgi:Ca2+-dependent lipid-binding protein